MFLDPEKSLNLFSSKGKLTQCDNALKAALNSALCLGCAAPDGAVLISSKNLGPLVDKANYHKVFQVCPSIGVTYSGLQPDFRAQLSVAQRICQNYYDVYQKFPYLDVFINEFCLNVQEYSQKGGFRPFGTFLIFTGQTKYGPTCYQMDPSGSFKKVDVVAAGKEYEDARKFVERRKESLDDNIVNGVAALWDFSRADVTPLDISIGVFSKKTGLFKVYNVEDVKEVFDSLKN
ncbi:hypothetical protein GINT2_001423 [Glugoides intestinalis]